MLPVDLFRLPIFALSVGTSVCSYSAPIFGFTHGDIAHGVSLAPLSRSAAITIIRSMSVSLAV